MSIRIPDMGHIVTNPQLILDFFKNGGWLVHKHKNKYYIYTTPISPEEEIDDDLFYMLDSYGYITHDSGNFDFNETYYRYDRDFESKHHYDIEFFFGLIKHTCNDLKPKYKQLIRQHKLERLCQ